MNIQRWRMDAIGTGFHQASIYVGSKMFCRESIERETNGAAEHFRVQRELTLIIAPHTNRRLLFDSDRQHIAVIVIRVLAQQIDPTGRLRYNPRRSTEHRLKTAHQSSR